MYGRFFPTFLALVALALSTAAAEAQGPGASPPTKVNTVSAPTPQPSVRLHLPAGVIPVDKPPQPYIAPPTHVQNTGDTNVCADHGGIAGALACSAAFQQSWLVLIWSWQAPATYSDPQHPEISYTVVSDIDGFHAYQVSGGGQHQPVSTASGGSALTMTAFAPPNTSAQCYVVRAFKGQLESADSQPFCPGTPQPTPITISVPPFAARTMRHLHLNGLAYCANPDSGIDMLFVGFIHCNNGPDQSQEVWRILAKFDLSSLGTVFNATLRFHRDVTQLQGTDPYDNNEVSTLPADEPLHGRGDANCAVEVLLPTYDWVNNGWDDSDPKTAPPVTDMPTVDYASIPTFASDISLDVTDQVLKWRMSPADNNGFAIRTWDEYTSEEDNNWCVSYYRDFSLQVTEMPPSGVTLIDPGTVVVPGAP